MILIKLCCCFNQDEKQGENTSCNSAVVLSSAECIVSQNLELNHLNPQIPEALKDADSTRKLEKIDSLVQNLPAQNPSFYDSEAKEVSSTDTPCFSDNMKTLVREPYTKPRLRRKGCRESNRTL